MIAIEKIKRLDDPRLLPILNRSIGGNTKIEKTVKDILKQVRLFGDQACLELAKKYDNLRGPLKCAPNQIAEVAKKCDVTVQKAIHQAIHNIKEFHTKQKESSWYYERPDGVKLGQKIRPLHRVGLYVPGGAGAYPSTVMMAAIPAMVAGVKEIVVVTPQPSGLHPSVAYTLSKLGIEEVYLIGGAQAVAMLAYGTKKVPRVDKIVGPCNVYASLAKKELFGMVDIDMIAGPSEILVLADESVSPDWVASDLLSQAEHGSGFEAALCITTSEEVAANISECVQNQVKNSPKREFLTTALRNFGRIYVVSDWKIGCDLANLLAPEHLELMVRDPNILEPKLVNAGAIFLGAYTSEPIGDYFAGPNHILPTNGSARFFSPLGVYDFYKRTSIIEYSQQAIKKQAKLIEALAKSEGFIHHADAVMRRL